MRLSNYKGDKALDLLVDLIDPIGEIASDPALIKCLQGQDIKGAAKLMLKEHRKAVIEVLSTLEGETPEAYMKRVNVMTLPMALIDLMNDPELIELFRYQGREMASSGSGTVTTTESEA